MSKVIEYRFRCRRRTAASWEALNEVLLPEEIGIESDTGLGKVGVAAGTPWNDLLYTIVGRVDLDGLADGKCLAWDATNSKWIVANRGAVYVPGFGVDIDSTNPEAPVISSTLGSIALSGYPATYAELPLTLGGGDAGRAYMVQADGLVYIWDGAAFPSNGYGVSLNAGRWRTVGLWSFSTDGATALVASEDLTGCSDLCVLVNRVTMSSSGWRQLILSVDGGATYFDSSDYETFDTNGVPTSATPPTIHSASSSAARSGFARMSGLNQIGFKLLETPTRTIPVSLLVSSDQPITNIAVKPTTGNFTGGSIQIIAR